MLVALEVLGLLVDALLEVIGELARLGVDLDLALAQLMQRLGDRRGVHRIVLAERGEQAVVVELELVDLCLDLRDALRDQRAFCICQRRELVGVAPQRDHRGVAPVADGAERDVRTVGVGLLAEAFIEVAPEIVLASGEVLARERQRHQAQPNLADLGLDDRHVAHDGRGDDAESERQGSKTEEDPR